MTLPKWIDPKITFGNILTIFTIIGGLVVAAQAYGAMGETVRQNTAAIGSLQAVDRVLEATDRALQDTASQDRLYVRETLAELKADVGYLRRGEEERRRQERSP